MARTAQDTSVDTDTGIMKNFPVSPYGDGFCFRADLKINGKRKQVRRSYDTELEAVEGYLAFMKDQQAFLEKQSADTVADIIDWWIAILTDEGCRPTTLGGNRWLLDHYVVPELGAVKASALTADQIRTVYRGMAARGLSTETIKNVHRKVKAALNRAVRERKLKENVANLVTPPKGKAPKKHIILTPAQIDQLLAVCREDRLAVCWVLAIFTGMRRGELAGLDWDQIDDATRTIHIDRQRTVGMIVGVVEGEVKTSASDRTIVLPQLVFDCLRDWKVRQTTERMALGRRWNAGNLVFTTRDGTPYRPSSLTRRFQHLAKKAGVPVLPLHHMRHTVITNALRDKIDTSAIAPFVGHKHGGITAKLYHHVDQDLSWELLQPMFDRLTGNAQ